MNDSPVKKLNFGGKENAPINVSVDNDCVETKKPAPAEVDLSLVAPTIRPEEMDEPLLRANPQRFVLFPIKYHEVCLTFSARPHLSASDA